MLVGLILYFTVLSVDSILRRRSKGSHNRDPTVRRAALWDRMAHKIDVLPESLGNEKSIWEYYNEMAAVVDDIEVEWRDLADTVLIFVCMALSTVHIC